MGAKLPCDECGGRCCTFAPMSRREFKTLRRIYGVPRGARVVEAEFSRLGLGVMVLRDGDPRGTCAYLDANGKCSAYTHRPKTCRVYGQHPSMPCVFVNPEAAEKAAEGLFDKLIPPGLLTRRSP